MSALALLRKAKEQQHLSAPFLFNIIILIYTKTPCIFNQKLINQMKNFFKEIKKAGKKTKKAVHEIKEKVSDFPSEVIEKTKQLTKESSSKICPEVLGHIFRKIIPRGAPFPHQWEGVQQWQARAKDGHRVHGWSWSPQQPTGTVILCHGFRQNAFLGPVRQAAISLRRRGDLTLVALNFRSHGPSREETHYPPTFGEAEKWDIRATLEYAESQNYPKPFILIGYSLGAMAASRILQEDGRISGGFLIAPPYKARHALRIALRRKKTPSPLVGFTVDMVESAIDSAYAETKKNIMSKGDVRNHETSPKHQPHICYWIGKDDEYGSEYLFDKIYRKWYGGCGSGAPGEIPGQVPDRLTWFVTGESKHRIGKSVWKQQCESVLLSFLSEILSK